MYPSLTASTNVRNKVATSQIAPLPTAASDGSALELATVTGSIAAGVKAALSVAVSGA